MKNNNTYYWFLTVLVLVALATYLSFKSRKNFKLYDESRIELLLSEQKVKQYNDRCRQKLFTENRILEDIDLTDVNNEKVPISSLITSPKLIFRFSDQFCKACIDDDIALLKQLGDSIGHQNIIIISDIGNARLLNIFKKTNEIESPCYDFTGGFNLSMENGADLKKIPFFLVLDEERNIHFAFFGDESSKLTEIYFSRIITYFNSNINK